MKNRNRYLLYLLNCGVLLYFGLPHLQLHGTGLARLFAISWLIFLFFAFAGNLAAYLYTPRRYRKKAVQVQSKRVKERSY